MSRIVWISACGWSNKKGELWEQLISKVSCKRHCSKGTQVCPVRKSQQDRVQASHLAGTVKASPKSSQCLQQELVLITLDSVEGTDLRQGLLPLGMEAKQPTNIYHHEGVFNILKHRGCWIVTGLLWGLCSAIQCLLLST